MVNFAKSHLLLIGLLLFILPQAVFAASENKIFYIGVVPIQPTPFENYDYNDFPSFVAFPKTLGEEADNACLDVFLSSTTIKPQPVHFSKEDIRDFYSTFREGPYRSVDHICLTKKPNVDVLIYFEVVGRYSRIKPDREIPIKIYSFYRKKNINKNKAPDSIEANFWRRTRRMEVYADDHLAVGEIMKERFLSIVDEFKRTWGVD